MNKIEDNHLKNMTIKEIEFYAKTKLNFKNKTFVKMRDAVSSKYPEKIEYGI